jgi:hypothetical protein
LIIHKPSLSNNCLIVLYGLSWRTLESKTHFSDAFSICHHDGFSFGIAGKYLLFLFGFAEFFPPFSDIRIDNKISDYL